MPTVKYNRLWVCFPLPDLAPRVKSGFRAGARRASSCRQVVGQRAPGWMVALVSSSPHNEGSAGTSQKELAQPQHQPLLENIRLSNHLCTKNSPTDCSNRARVCITHWKTQALCLPALLWEIIQCKKPNMCQVHAPGLG